MSTTTEPIVLREFGYLLSGSNLSERTFSQLREFVCGVNDQLATSEDAAQFMRLTMYRTKSGKRVEALQAQSYVGVLTTKSGVTVEILPKITHLDGDTDQHGMYSRDVFLHMLATLRNAPFKNLGRSNLYTQRNQTLYELFILMFVSEVESIETRGFRSGYLSHEENARFLRGKLLVAQDLRHNPIDKSRIFVRHTRFELNRPENRLIKTTLGLLFHASRSNDTRRRMARLLDILASVDTSHNIDADFRLCIPNRNMVSYTQALAWCRVFLHKESFTAFRGGTASEALLFPMERIFEDYVPHLMRNELVRGGYNGWQLSAQDGGYSLFDDNRRPRLRPDIVLRNSSVNRIVILDTKWKELRELKPSVPDLYQMYAYGKRYQDKNSGYRVSDVILVYPATEQFTGWTDWTATSSDQRSFRVRLFFLDLASNFGRSGVHLLLQDLLSEGHLSPK